MTRLVVELAGPAGAGKTTLARELRAAHSPDGSDGVRMGVQTGVPQRAAALLAAGPHLAAARATARGRWWTRNEMRDLAYLGAWREPVRREAGSPDRTGGGLLLLDHGPVFRLTSLAALGPPMTNTRAFQTWWTGLAHEWGRLLDVVVWLDAPDAVLVRRIAMRAQNHRIRGADPAEAARFLARYRAAYSRTLDVVTGAGARLVEFETTSGPPDRLAAAVRAALLRPTSPSGRHRA